MQAITYVYDGDGNRVKKIENGVTTVYVNKYCEITSGVVTSNYYLGDKLVAVKKDTNLSFIYQDHLGSTSATADAGGTLTSTSKQLPYGAMRLTTGALPTDKLFTGQRRDIAMAGSELYFYGARYYDPQIGRFISADTIVPRPGNPQSLNRYSYCLNNPLRYIDPTGHAGEGLEAPSEEGQLGWTSAGGYVISVNGKWVSITNDSVDTMIDGFKQSTSNNWSEYYQSQKPDSSNLLPIAWGGNTVKMGDKNYVWQVYQTYNRLNKENPNEPQISLYECSSEIDLQKAWGLTRYFGGVLGYYGGLVAVGVGIAGYPFSGGKSLSVSASGVMFANGSWNVAADGWNTCFPNDPNPMPKSPFWFPSGGMWRGIFP